MNRAQMEAPLTMALIAPHIACGAWLSSRKTAPQLLVPKALRTNGKMDSLEGQEVATISAESPKNPFIVLIATLPCDKLQPSAVTGFSIVSHFTYNIPT
jgi:hypothetical protein